MQPGSFNKLEQRLADGSYRQLDLHSAASDFWSNDYLGISRLLKDCLHSGGGSTGSRLISGNSSEAENCEAFLADFFEAEAALIFNSGYDANLGLFSSISTRNDLVLYDEYVHASVRDGIRLGLGKSFSFRHNDLNDLEDKIKRHKESGSSIFIAVESLYSMDGDFAPLKGLAALARQYGAFLIVDEAHSSGVFGPEGKGLCVEQQITEELFARVHTFGKAYGSHGACVLGSPKLKSFLVNFARSFIYTTALPPQSYELVREAIAFSRDEQLREKLRANTALFIALNKEYIEFSSPGSPIQVISLPELDKLQEAAVKLREAGFGIKLIQSPTVPKGMERIRVCLHAFNTEKEIALFSELLCSHHSPG